ncbi:hypothetical protein ACFVZJ_21175 [Streptomyces sp. NPDC058322]|uniref:hypothetical protein n=1 Tax=Streptomyces sp. NPDC058322 TaxID=3346446 RepID=UPI0036E8607A
MSNIPYTNADLRAEAADQHNYLTEDPDFMGIGEAMDDSIVTSTEDGPNLTWGDLLPDEDAFNDAQKKIRTLIVGAADVSKWAVHLGADGLEPINTNLTIKNRAGEDRVRLHFAFAPDMDEDKREAVMEVIADAIRQS